MLCKTYLKQYKGVSCLTQKIQISERHRVWKNLFSLCFQCHLLHLAISPNLSLIFRQKSGWEQVTKLKTFPLKASNPVLLIQVKSFKQRETKITYFAGNNVLHLKLHIGIDGVFIFTSVTVCNQISLVNFIESRSRED